MIRIRSLRSQLLTWLLAPLAIVATVDAWLTHAGARNTATLVQDRLLLGSARTIAEQTHATDGLPDVAIPPSALEMLDAGQQDHAYYRVSSSEGNLLSGYADLPAPPRLLTPETYLGFDAVFRGQSIRVVAFAQPLFKVGSEQTVIIEVAQTTHGLEALTRDIWQHAVREQLLMLLLVAGCLLLGLRRALRPLIALRDQVSHRSRSTAIDVRSAPAELQPIIAALNEYAGRLDRHMASHSRFIADASHHLRTPLAVLNMQIAFALRHTDATTTREVLIAMRASIQSNIRLVQQLMAFTEAESGLRPPPARTSVAVAPIVHAVLEELASLADARAIDLGFEERDPSLIALVGEHQLHVLASNLIDNALRYTREGGVVTVRVVGDGVGRTTLEVLDDGPGIPPSQRQRVLERFVRLDASDGDGCGLGLAIVQEIVTECGASIVLSDASRHGGLCVAVSFRASEAPAVERTPRSFNGPRPRTAVDAI